VRGAGDDAWRDVPRECNDVQKDRGVGRADRAQAIGSGRPHRASGEMAYHVIDIIHGFHEASAQGRHIDLASSCARPAPLPVGLSEWEIDD